MDDLTGVRWHKASYSGSNGGCVEVGVKSSTDGDMFLVRDTKDRAAGHLTFNTTEWDAFIAGVKDGEFDRNSF
jgi:Domain of unknown function (DUF397)